MFLVYKKDKRSDVFGKEQEARVCAYLKAKGYEILERNFKCKLGEIDVICEKDNRIVFVEIKSRRSTNFGYGREALYEDRKHSLKISSQFYLKYYVRHNTTKKTVRYDLIDVYKKDITHIEGIF